MSTEPTQGPDKVPMETRAPITPKEKKTKVETLVAKPIKSLKENFQATKLKTMNFLATPSNPEQTRSTTGNLSEQLTALTHKVKTMLYKHPPKYNKIDVDNLKTEQKKLQYLKKIWESDTTNQGKRNLSTLNKDLDAVNKKLQTIEEKHSSNEGLLQAFKDVGFGDVVSKQTDEQERTTGVKLDVGQLQEHLKMRFLPMSRKLTDTEFFVVNNHIKSQILNDILEKKDLDPARIENLFNIVKGLKENISEDQKNELSTLINNFVIKNEENLNNIAKEIEGIETIKVDAMFEEKSNSAQPIDATTVEIKPKGKTHHAAEVTDNELYNIISGSIKTIEVDGETREIYDLPKMLRRIAPEIQQNEKPDNTTTAPAENKHLTLNVLEDNKAKFLEWLKNDDVEGIKNFLNQFDPKEVKQLIDGKTVPQVQPLALAISEGSDQILEYFLQAGGNPNQTIKVKDKEYSLLSFAELRKEPTKAPELLRKHGAEP